MSEMVLARQLALGELDERYSGLRLQATAEVRQAMIQSLRRYGQLSPVVVWPTAGVWVLIDGFKRLEAARHLPELATLAARPIEADARTAKAAMYGMNQGSRRIHLLEEAWIVCSLVREEGLTQPEAAQLLGRNKSWISRRLALLEKLCPSAREDLALGLLSPSMARQLTRLPVGNQEALLAAIRRDDLSVLEVKQAVYTIDFSAEGRRRVNLFSYVLGYSRRQYLHFTESQDFETLLREHVRAFGHLGGVAATCLYDNMKTVVDRWEGGGPVYNVRFLAFAAHYGFRPWACRPRRAQTKGKVERPFQYVESNLLNGRTFNSLEHLNQVARHWLANTADVRLHRETRKRPLDAHAEELPHLLPLPVVPYDTARFVYRTVDAEGMISYERNLYSAPWRLLGRMLPVRVGEEELVLYDPRNLKEAGRHALFPRHSKGQRQVRDEHRPSRNTRRPVTT